jgi:hypothetical protein
MKYAPFGTIGIGFFHEFSPFPSIAALFRNKSQFNRSNVMAKKTQSR